jgi:hypothetical protein
MEQNTNKKITIEMQKNKEEAKGCHVWRTLVQTGTKVLTPTSAWQRPSGKSLVPVCKAIETKTKDKVSISVGQSRINNWD